MRRPKKAAGASLDSLLDTMTNVVGIMVILLTVTQLGVGDAVKRISKTIKIDPEEMARIEKELAETQKLRDELIQQLKMLVHHNEQRDDAAEELAELRKRIVDEKANNRAMREMHQSKVDEVMAEARRERDEAKALLEQQEKEADELRQKINQQAEQLAKLRAQLADTPEPVSPPAKVVYLPNPRPAPEGAKPFTVLCREGLVLPVLEEAIQEAGQLRVNFVIQRRQLAGNEAEGIDADILGKEVNRMGIKDPTGNFEPQLIFHGRYPRLKLVPESGAGENAEQIQRRGSRYQQILRRIDPKKFYLRFIVWPDSFEAYLEARKIASEMGLSAGWRAVGDNHEHVIPLGGKVRVGPPPKPKPKPEKPSPPKKPKPPPPIDVID
jgi:hypothetical protein